jgi:hypothetical protein
MVEQSCRQTLGTRRPGRATIISPLPPHPAGQPPRPGPPGACQAPAMQVPLQAGPGRHRVTEIQMEGRCIHACKQGPASSLGCCAWTPQIPRSTTIPCCWQQHGMGPHYSSKDHEHAASARRAHCALVSGLGTPAEWGRTQHLVPGRQEDAWAWATRGPLRLGDKRTPGPAHGQAAFRSQQPPVVWHSGGRGGSQAGRGVRRQDGHQCAPTSE